MKRVDERFIPWLALVPPFVALGLQLSLWSVIAPFSWFLFFPAVFISSWIGGLRPGLVATAISASVAWYFFVVPRYVLFKGATNTLLTLTVFVVMGVLFSVFHERLRRANARAADALTESRLSNEALVTSNQRIVDLLERTRKLDAVKTEFFANISHELRTPLTLILLPLERLIAVLAPDDPHRAELEAARRNAQLLLAHVNNLLDAAKLDAGGVELHYAEVDLVRLTRLTASFFESRAVDRDIGLSVITPESLMAQVDPAQIRRVLLNLLSNAFIFTPDGGAVRVEVTADGGTVALQVVDSGPGVPVEEREVIFERFHQGKERDGRSTAGTGLGLSIVHDVVALHGGTVTVGEAPEGGALFTIVLPATAPPDTQVGTAEMLPWDEVALPPEPVGVLPRTAADPSTVLGDDRAVVLVVEDNPDLNELIAITLRDRYQVHSAYNGQEGIDLARTHRPDVIVTDVMMPVLGGEELVDLVRADSDLATTAILVVSARADEAGRMKLLSAGANDYLVKPFNIAELQVRIANLVALHRAESALLGEAVRDLADQRSEQALEINDQIVQGLSSAAYAVERGDIATAGRAVSTTLDAARKVIADLSPARPHLVPVPSEAPLLAADEPDNSEKRGQVRAVIADDTADIRSTIRAVLETLTDVEVVGEAANGLEAVEAVAALHPDLLLLDLSMPVMTGMQALARIRAATTSTKVVVLSGYGRDQAAVDALAAGAAAYVEKGGSTRRLVTLIADLFPGRVRVTGRPPDANAGSVQAVAAPSAEDPADLVAVYVHELKNPLAVATGIAELLAEPDGRADADANTEMLASLTRSLGRMNRLVDSLTEANRIGAGNLSLAIEPVDLVELIRTTISESAATLGDRSVNLVADGPVIAPVDPFRIRQVIENLLSNAVKFSPAGTGVDVRVQADQSKVSINVTDLGSGVPTEKQALLFRKFERLGSGVPGIGLGLYLSREIARAHNGDLAYCGGPTSSFVLTLPRLTTAVT